MSINDANLEIPSIKQDGDLTVLLLKWSEGDARSLDELTPLVYNHLHRLARHIMVGERPGHLLQVTELVNEAYLRLIDSHRVAWRDRAHFFALAARLMRRILVDIARSQNCVKRAAGNINTSLDENLLVSNPLDMDLVALDEALECLAAMDPRKAHVVEFRFFGGLEEKEIAELLDVSIHTVRRDWKAARAWLYGRLTTPVPLNPNVPNTATVPAF